MSSSSSLDIEPADVIRLLQQYLKENNLYKTLQTLQEETSVNLNTVDSIDTFVQDINSGHWDVVLRVVKILKLPDQKLIDLYEQIAIELIELKETRAANWLIHKTEPLLKLKSLNADRYLHLSTLLNRPYFDYKEAYRDGSTRERRRNVIAQALKKEVTVVPPQRLLTLISDALKWQKHEGLLPSSSSIDIFTGKAHMVHAEEETHPNVLHKHCVKPPKSGNCDIFVSCADFTPDGHYLVVGYSTGLIEIRNPTTGRLAYDLKYQSSKNFIVTPTKKAALSICFGLMNDLLAIGDKSGDISIWKVETGQIVQLFKSVHFKGINCLLFHKNGREILSGGHDAIVRLNGMRSNKTIRDFQGHKSAIYSVAFSKDDNYIISGSSDSTVKIWNAKTSQMLHEFKSQARVHTVLTMSNFKGEIFLIGNQSKCIQLIDLECKVRTKLEAEDNLHKEEEEETETMNKQQEKPVSKEPIRQSEFYAACLSPKGNWIYAVDSRHLYCFNYSTKSVQKKLVVHEEVGNDLIGVRNHPFLNLIATFDTQGNLKLWKP